MQHSTVFPRKEVSGKLDFKASLEKLQKNVTFYISLLISSPWDIDWLIHMRTDYDKIWTGPWLDSCQLATISIEVVKLIDLVILGTTSIFMLPQITSNWCCEWVGWFLHFSTYLNNLVATSQIVSKVYTITTQLLYFNYKYNIICIKILLFISDTYYVY